MKKIVIICIFLLFSFSIITGLSFAQPLVTGNQYYDFPKPFRILYIRAFNEGWIQYLVLYDAKEEKGKWFCKEEPLGKMTLGQQDAIIMKYLKENPEIWHEPIANIIVRKFLDMYKDRLVSEKNLKSLKN